MNNRWLDILSMEEKQEAVMRKRLILTGFILCAVLSLWKAAGRPREETVEARFATVQRGDVHQVAAIVGRLAYTEEEYIYAPASGIVSRICAVAGQRVSAGDLLLCYDSTVRDEAVAAMSGIIPAQTVDTISEHTDVVLRSEKNCTVREVLMKEGMPVAAGTPIMRTSSAQQRIVCSVSSTDMNDVETGKWASVSWNGQKKGTVIIHEIGGEMVDPDTGITMHCVTLLPEGHIDLPEGAALDVDVFLAGSDDVMSLPVEAITDRETVWWVNDGRCTEIPAQIVLCDEMRAWVDLPEGLTVAIGEFYDGQRIAEASR